MKKLPLFLTSLLCLTIFLSSCKKHVVQPVNQLSLLPPATQTGANTFGCLVNGQAFVPGGSIFSAPFIQCNYIFTGGGYNLTVAATNKENTNLYKGVIVATDSLQVVEGQTFTFNKFKSGNADASYTLYPDIGIIQYETTNKVSGSLWITKLDTIHQIVSGTFNFNAINSALDTVKITDGRFDMHYTR
jgi:hypothetical protein